MDMFYLVQYRVWSLLGSQVSNQQSRNNLRIRTEYVFSLYLGICAYN
jgi:hypothetical protein